jgi:hypothetical protein
MERQKYNPIVFKGSTNLYMIITYYKYFAKKPELVLWLNYYEKYFNLYRVISQL